MRALILRMYTINCVSFEYTFFSLLFSFCVPERIKTKSGNPNVHVRVVDVSDLESVRKFAAQVIAEEEHLHILVITTCKSW